MNTPETTLNTEITLRILQGLLASGHYTTQMDGEDELGYRQRDAGSEWEKDGIFARRHLASAIEDAIDISNQFQDQLKLEAKNKTKEQS